MLRRSEGYCSLHIEKMKKVINLVASEPESNANLIIFSLYVDYKGTPRNGQSGHLSFKFSWKITQGQWQEWYVY